MAQNRSIAVIIGATPATCTLERAQARDDWALDLVDLKDFNLPLFIEAASNAWMPSEDPAAPAWQEKFGSYDSDIFVTPEYNRSILAR